MCMWCDGGGWLVVWGAHLTNSRFHVQLKDTNEIVSH